MISPRENPRLFHHHFLATEATISGRVFAPRLGLGIPIKVVSSREGPMSSKKRGMLSYCFWCVIWVSLKSQNAEKKWVHNWVTKISKKLHEDLRRSCSGAATKIYR